jgi:hypothetical protein
VFREGCCFLTDRPLETFELLQIDPWPGYTGNPIDADQIPARGFIGGAGQVGENVHGLSTVSGVAGVGEQGQAAEVRGTSLTFQRPEGRRAVRKWLGSFHAMMWC